MRRSATRRIPRTYALTCRNKVATRHVADRAASPAATTGHATGLPVLRGAGGPLAAGRPDHADTPGRADYRLDRSRMTCDH